MSIDYPLEGTKHPPRPFHLSSFPLLPLSLWCRRLIWMLPASHFSMSLALAWRRLLHHARARSYVRLKCQNEWSGDQPDIPTLNDPHFTTGAPRENPNWALIANSIEKHFAISPPEAGALVKCFGSSLLLICREMCEEQQSGKSKYRPASIGRLSLDDRFRIKERAERTLNLPEWRPISALNRASNRWPRTNASNHLDLDAA